MSPSPEDRARRVLLEVREIRDGAGQVTERDWIKAIAEQIRLAIEDQAADPA